jgi:hypothetical protein
MAGSIVINNIEYLLYESVTKLKPIFCRNTHNGNDLIDKVKIDKTNYMYARYNNNKVITSFID